jgi:serine/threonine protein kinase
MAEVNETIGGYRLRSHLQTGQYSQVFEVVEPHSFRHFAMKVLLPEHADNQEKRSELFHEAEVGTKLRHENVIHILKVDRDKHSPHFIMEFFPSGSLRTRLMAKDMKAIWDIARKIFKQAATGLAYMHGSGWVHRDVKPDNMLVNATGQLKLIDFAITKKVPTGFAKWFYRKPSKAEGTASYLAPEQILRQPPDPRQDIYSLGVSFWELLTGRKPYTGMTSQELLQKHFTEKPVAPQHINKDVTDEMGALVLKMMAKKKEDRPQTCHDVLMTLRKIKIFKNEVLSEEEAMMR